MLTGLSFMIMIKHRCFFETLVQDFDEAPMMVRSNLQIIFNAFIAIDGVFSESEADVALEILNKIDDGTTDYLPEKDEPAEESVKSNGSTGNNGGSRSASKPEVNIDDVDIQSCLDELEALVGLDGVKNEVLQCINLLRINNMRKEKGLSALQTSNHMVFTGHPGTGKTTVALVSWQKYINVLVQYQSDSL